MISNPKLSLRRILSRRPTGTPSLSNPFSVISHNTLGLLLQLLRPLSPRKSRAVPLLLLLMLPTNIIPPNDALLGYLANPLLTLNHLYHHHCLLLLDCICIPTLYHVRRAKDERESRIRAMQARDRKGVSRIFNSFACGL